MLRFIDLTGQITSGFEFAWYDTVRDKFLTVDGEQTWDCWEDFERDAKEDSNFPPLHMDRFKSLFPKDKFLEDKLC